MASDRTLFTSIAISAMFASSALAFPTGPPAGFDGSPASGFNSCTFCHTGALHNGGVQVLGAPARYVPGRLYNLTVRVFDPIQFGAGFELSVETPNGLHVGQLLVNDAVNTQFASADPHFVTHTMAGHVQSEVSWIASGNSADFNMQWKAPATNVGPIDFYAAGNADNDNFAASGDSIYTTAFPSQFNVCLPDLNGDGVVNAGDLASLLGAWGTANPNADINGDGIVSSADLAGMLGAWGICP